MPPRNVNRLFSGKLRYVSQKLGNFAANERYASSRVGRRMNRLAHSAGRGRGLRGTGVLSQNIHQTGRGYARMGLGAGGLLGARALGRRRGGGGPMASYGPGWSYAGGSSPYGSSGGMGM